MASVTVKSAHRQYSPSLWGWGNKLRGVCRKGGGIPLQIYSVYRYGNALRRKAVFSHKAYLNEERQKAMEEIWEKIEGNLPFIRGITVSGGECTLQADVVRELFAIARKHGLTTLLDSNGSYDFRNHPELMEVSDGVMLDVKADNEERHQWLTGHSIDIVLENLQWLASADKLEEIRTVCIPGSLENEKTIEVAGDILKPYLEKKDIRYKLIKYRHFGVRQQYRDFKEPSEEYMKSLKRLAEKKGFRNIVII